MKWLNDKIIVISFVWWLLQGVLLLLNELRVWLVYNYVMSSFLVLSICLIIVSFLLWLKNRKIVLLLSISLLLYSVVSLIFLCVLFVLESHGNNWTVIFLVVPILNILLSTLLMLMLRSSRKEIK